MGRSVAFVVVSARGDVTRHISDAVVGQVSRGGLVRDSVMKVLF
jgi:hypothetical protein